LGLSSFDQLMHEDVLQSTNNATIEKVRSPSGEVFVRKHYKTNCRSFEIEASLLESVTHDFQYLVLPRIVGKSGTTLLMSYVDRVVHDRNTIVEQPWTRKEISALSRAIKEFQSIRLPRHAFSVKQIVMGWCYPSVKSLMTLWPALRQNLLQPQQAVMLVAWSFFYAALRPFLRNVTTHYDLTPLNCAMTPDGRVSILDFEFSYFGGDSLFDLAYFTTIPPQSLQRWDFQSKLISDFVGRNPSIADRFRLRLLLVICCLVRARYFADQTEERKAYEASLALLFNRREYSHWWNAVRKQGPINCNDGHRSLRCTGL